MTVQPLKRNTAYFRTHRVVSVFIMAVSAVVIISLFRSIYDSTRRYLRNIWENNVQQMARNTEYYLARPADAIEFTAIQIENMIQQGQSDQEILRILEREMETFVPLVDNNYTGVYGYIRGNYLDAAGWVPPGGYVPQERPWYIAAKAANGKVAFVSPFSNLQLHNMTLSVAKLLSDGESVLSMDIFLDALQEMTASMTEDECVIDAMILDKTGRVVAHSQNGEIGADYASKGNAYQAALAEQALRENDSGLSIRESGRKELVFSEQINDDWYAVLILDEDKMMSPVKNLNLVLVLVLLIMILIWYGISYRVSHKYEEAEELSREIKAVADIYNAMVLIDLKSDTMKILRSSPLIESLFQGDLTNFRGRITAMAEQIASESSRDMLVQFMDPSTYDERIQNVNSISHDFMDANNLWMRIQLIVAEKDPDGKLKQIIWALESIDKEHKQQEQLRQLADTDALSRLRNRRSGEAGIRSRLEAGEKGIFILVDVDYFKSINDNYGHKTGDLVIVAIADELKKMFRDDDIVYRLGGDEFAVFITGTDEIETGSAIALRIQQRISEIVLPELKGERISVSVGAAASHGNPEVSFDEIYQLADQRMYENKRQNRGFPE